MLIKLYKKDSSDRIWEWTIEQVDNKYRTIHGLSGGNLVTSEWTVCFGKNIGRANATTDEEQAVSDVNSIVTKKRDDGYSDTVTGASEIDMFKPMLAKNYTDYKDKIKYPIFGQYKFDGIRCNIFMDGVRCIAQSRKGKPFATAGHIIDELYPILITNPNIILDGELYCESDCVNFEKIVSLIKKTKPTKEALAEARVNIKYHVYDIYDKNNPEMKYSERSKLIKKLIINKEYCKFVDYRVLNNAEEVEADLKMCIASGYEGQILRVDSHYEQKRSDKLLKHKKFMDDEFLITGVEEGVGNRTGTVGAFNLVDKNGNSFKSNVKGTYSYTKELWNNRQSLINKMATVKFFELTENGIPRFPYVIAIRDYE